MRRCCEFTGLPSRPRLSSRGCLVGFDERVGLVSFGSSTEARHSSALCGVLPPTGMIRQAPPPAAERPAWDCSPTLGSREGCARRRRTAYTLRLLLVVLLHAAAGGTAFSRRAQRRRGARPVEDLATARRRKQQQRPCRRQELRALPASSSGCRRPHTAAVPRRLLCPSAW